VDVNVEQAAFTKNTMMYQASLHFLDRRVKGMLRVIRGE
jgi:flagellar basal body rod protein FlgB